MSRVPVAPPLPTGFSVVLDRETRCRGDGVVFGGSPPRLLRLSTAGQRAFQELRQKGPVSPGGAVLARRLTDAGMAHPIPPRPTAVHDVTVVIPVRDRPVQLERALRRLGDWPVVVVDDASLRGDAVAAVGERYGARVVHHGHNAGPGPARNTGWRSVTTELVAFLDSDASPPPGWVESLARHFADPLVAAAAPRIVPSAGPQARAVGLGDVVGRYAASRSPLDLGPRPAVVRPGSRVAYVPTTALVVRRAALVEVGGFDDALRYGEDVDLVWRLAAAGWRVRYDPSVTVGHDEPEHLVPLLRRRFSYGTSAAELSRRHPDALASVVLPPWALSVIGALLGRRPGLALAGAAAWTGVLVRRHQGMPVPAAASLVRRSVSETWIGLGRSLAQFTLPLTLIALAWPGDRRSSWRLATWSLLAAPPLAEWVERAPRLDPLRFSALYLADEAAYGAGVLRGCLAARHWVPLRPRLAVRVPRGPGAPGFRRVPGRSLLRGLPRAFRSVQK